MKKLVWFLGVILLVGIGYFLVRGRDLKVPKKKVSEMAKEESLEKPKKKEEAGKVKLTAIYDNNPFDRELETGWGFSCLVETGDKTVLFDTGADSPTLLSNMEKLEIASEDIDIVVLSHIHGDHVGGLSGFLENNNQVVAYIPSSFPTSFKESIKSAGADFIEVSDPTKIINGVYSTGELGVWIKEQSLVTKTDKGLVVITGCAHPGAVNIVKKAKEMTDEEVYLVLGGFHLGGASDSEILDIIKDLKALGVQKAAPCHCSGDRCRELFKREYGDNYIEVGVGKILKL